MRGSIFTIGTCELSRGLLEAQERGGRPLNLSIIGSLTLAGDVTPELIEAALGRVFVRGPVYGPAAAVAALRAKMR